MKDLAREGRTMIVVTHEMKFAREAASRVVFLDNGRIVEIAPAEVFFEKPASERARQFLERYRQRRPPWTSSSSRTPTPHPHRRPQPTATPCARGPCSLPQHSSARTLSAR